MKTGDRVICIDASARGSGNAPPLIKEREYIIYSTDKCSCGIISFDVGLLPPSYSSGFTRCNCGDRKPNRGVHWCYSNRFAKIKEEYRIIHMDIEIEEPILN